MMVACRRLLLSLALSVLMASSSLGQEITVPAQSSIFLQDPATGSFRVLLSFPGLDSLAGREVHFAHLILPSVEVSSGVRLSAYRVTRCWDPATVSWTEPWQEPGGDYDPRLLGSYFIHPGRDPSKPIWLDVTSFVDAVTGLGQPNWGILLAPPAQASAGFDSSLASAFASLSSAVIVAHFGEAGE